MTEGQKKYPLWAEHDIVGFNIDEERIKEMDLNDIYRPKRVRSFLFFRI